MMSLRRPPSFIPGIPCCHPGMTWLRGNVTAWPLLHEESNVAPVDHETPVYCTVTVDPFAATAPVPSWMSWITRVHGGEPFGTFTSGLLVGAADS